MDPFGAAAGGVGVLGGLLSSIKTVHNIVEVIKDAPKEIKELAEEIKQTRAVVTDVMRAMTAAGLHDEPHPTAPNEPLVLSTSLDSDLPPPHTPNTTLVSDLVSRINPVLEGMHDLVSYLVVLDTNEVFKVKRVTWIRKRQKAKALRQQLGDLKMHLTTLMVTQNLTRVTKIGSNLEGLALLSLSRQEILARLLMRTTRGQTDAQFELHRPHLEASHAHHTDCTETEHTQPEQTMLALDQVHDTIEEDGRWERNNPEEDTAIDNICQYNRHDRQVVCTPIVFQSILGRCVLGLKGVALNQRQCVCKGCRKRGKWSISMSYYFPTWLLSQSIILQCIKAPIGWPSVGLYTRRRIRPETRYFELIEKNDIQGIQRLFQDGMATPNDVEPFSFSALTCAIGIGRVDVVKYLLKHGADATLEDDFGNSALDFAWTTRLARTLAPNMLAFCMTSSVFFMKSDDDPTSEALKKFCFSKVHRTILRLDYGISLAQLPNESAHSIINLPDRSGQTPLFWAARRGDVDSVRQLLARGAKTELADAMRRTPLFMAARSRNEAIIGLLLYYGADPTVTTFINETAAHYACYEEDSDRLLRPLLPPAVNVNAAAKNGRTMLDIVVERDFAKASQFLLERGANPDGVAVSGALKSWEERPLGIAIIHQAGLCIRSLINSNCDLLFVDELGRTVLHIVAQYGCIDCIAAFKGSDIEADLSTYTHGIDSTGRVPIDIADARSNEEPDFAAEFRTWVDALQEHMEYFDASETIVLDQA